MQSRCAAIKPDIYTPAKRDFQEAASSSSHTSRAREGEREREPASDATLQRTGVSYVRDVREVDSRGCRRVPRCVIWGDIYIGSRAVKYGICIG